MKRELILENRWVQAAVIAGMWAGVLWIAHCLGRPAESDMPPVPLGVEQAAIVTYGGSPIVVPPYKWGVAVSVRIANSTRLVDGTVYDVRYLVNRSGVFDLRDYLAAEDGGPLPGLPSFKFRGDPKLSKELETRIVETETVDIDIQGGYSATLWGLGVVWIVWFLILFFSGRQRPLVVKEGEMEEDQMVSRLRQWIDKLEGGTLGSEERAQMEMLLIRHWRQRLALAGLPMWRSVLEMGRHSEVGVLMGLLQGWIHARDSKVDPCELAARLADYLKILAPLQCPSSTS